MHYMKKVRSRDVNGPLNKTAKVGMYLLARNNNGKYSTLIAC